MAEANTNPWDQPTVRFYLGLCVAGLAIVFLVLFSRGLGIWSVFPILVGGIGLAARWRWTPVLMLLATAGVLATDATAYGLGFRIAIPRVRFIDWILCVGVLAFVLGHYRLQGLLVFLFPPDPRKRLGETARFLFFFRRKPPLQHRRQPEGVDATETSLALVLLPFWATIAQVVWLLLPLETGRMSLPPRLERALILIWSLGIFLLVCSALLRHAVVRGWRPDEARLYLQDLAWREICRDLRRLARWQVWAKLRRRRRKELP